MSRNFANRLGVGILVLLTFFFMGAYIITDTNLKAETIRLQDCQKELIQKEVSFLKALSYKQLEKCQEDLKITIQEIEDKELYDDVMNMLKVKNGKN